MFYPSIMSMVKSRIFHITTMSHLNLFLKEAMDVQIMSFRRKVLFWASRIACLTCLGTSREDLYFHNTESFSFYRIGENIKLLIDRPDGSYCFRLHKDRVYYVNEELVKRGESIARPNLLSIGTCFGKFTGSGKFRLQITALDYLAPYAKYKIWLKPSAEQQFLYGHHVMKSGLGRITENTEQYQGLIVYNMADLPLGFGVAAKSTQECRHTDPMTIIAFHQADIGEYIRNENALT